ncbi:putative tRNA (Uracil-O(2)-)-methyltransferase [Dirofilaria immitis]|nr:putative tRNA (Uracil-O(2)-)-methyltransferase [Dirofilaria immitis]
MLFSNGYVFGHVSGMDCTKIATAPLSASLEYDIREAFSKVIDIWKERCHTVNRRLLGVILIDERDSNHDHILTVANILSRNVQIHKVIPSLEKYAVEFRPCVLDDKRHPHVSFPYRLALEKVSDHQWNLSLFVLNSETNYAWLRKSHFLTWTERTNPQKFVYEDCAIAAYLIAYWRQKRFLPRSFCDIGCGNGLLINGYGIDLRQRRIWKKFVGTDLREKTLNPIEDLLSDSDFLIGNHTDELTPWIPIMAASRFQKKCGMATASVYSSYLLFIRDICLRLGYCVEEDRLKIPSMKRHCFLCTVPASGLVENVENIINNMLAYTNFRHFVPREKVERVKNCSQLSWDFRQLLTTKIFRHLFELPSDKSTMNIYWRCGQSCPLKEIANLLNEEEKAQLRDSDGGLQTFLKNQHQVFKVVKGTVSIRNWAEEGKRSVGRKLRTSDCWFYKYHSGGCPLSAEDCSYKH